MTDYRNLIRDVLAEKSPGNDNIGKRETSIRPARQERVDELLRQLNAILPSSRTFERPGRIILHPAPYQRARIT